MRIFLGFLREILMEIRDGLDAFVKIHQVEFFIGGVQVIAIQPKSHKYDLDAQLFFVEVRIGDAAATADGNWSSVDYGFEVFAPRLVGPGIDMRNLASAGMTPCRPNATT